MSVILTFGYSGNKIDDLLKIVGEYDCDVYDVRLVPLSRFRPEWSKNNLAKTIGGRYIHAGGLGNKNYKSGPIELKDPQPWIEEIKKKLRIKNVLLLCSCKDVSICHRSVVADNVSRLTGCKILNL